MLSSIGICTYGTQEPVCRRFYPTAHLTYAVTSSYPDAVE